MNVNLSAFEEKSEGFNAAHPYPHIVTDNLFSQEFCRDFVKGIPAKNDKWNHHSTTTSEKWTCPLNTERSAAQKEMYDALMSEEMTDSMRTLTGIDDLATKGGPRIIRVDPEGYLHIHTDRGLLEDKTYRAVNMLIYLNKNWQPEWNGCLDIRDAHGNLVRQIIPSLGRTVIFLNVKDAWHGHPKRLSTPDGRSRIAIQQYYFTRNSVGNESHTTYYFHDKPILRKLNRQ